MTPSRDPDRLIHAFLLEGEEELRDQVYDAVRAEIEHTRQRVVIGPWRMPAMNRIVGFGLAAAVVVVALVVGTQLLGSPTTNVGGPGADPTATPEASGAEPTATPEPSSTPEGLLPEGTFVLSDGEFDDGERNVPIMVTIPAPGWYGEPGEGILIKNDNADAPDGAGMIGPFVGDIYVPADPCQWSTTMPDTPATTVDEVVAALQGQASRDASEPVDITVDGHAGKSITLHVPDDAVFAQCDRTEFCTLTMDDPGICHRYSQDPGQIDELWILDVDGMVAVVNAAYYDGTPAEHVAEVRAILESMTFE